MNQPKKSSQSRRLRKKLYLDEFATEGFELDFEFKAVKSADELNAFVAELMNELITPNQLNFIGSACIETIAGVIIHAERYESVTAEQRQAVNDWLKAHSDIKAVEAGELVDANILL